MTTAKKAENSILTAWRARLWEPFCEAIARYRLIEAGDRVAVCISGGKDSMLLAKMMQMYRQRADIPFDLHFIVMDPGYNTVNRKKIEENAALLEIPVNIFESDIFQIANATEKSPCYLCARMRRGHLYAYAQQLGCNKIALGHHFSDVIETTLMGWFYGSQVQAMLPKLRATNFTGMQLIRPLYCVHEEDIIAWCRDNGLEFIQCACRFTENREVYGDGSSNSKRQEIKELLKRLRAENPGVEQSVFESIHRVNTDTVPLYKACGKAYPIADRKNN